MRRLITILSLAGGVTVAAGSRVGHTVLGPLNDRVEQHFDSIQSDDALIEDAAEGVDELRADVAALVAVREEIEAEVRRHQAELARAQADVRFHTQEIVDHESALEGDQRFRVAGVGRAPTREELVASQAHHERSLQEASRKVKRHRLVLERIAERPERSRERHEQAVNRLLEHEAAAYVQGLELKLARHDERAARVVSADRPRTDATRSQFSDAMSEIQRRIAEADAAWGSSDPLPTRGLELVLDAGCLPMDVVILER